MPRPALDPEFKASRVAAARQKAVRLNRKLPRNVYAFSTPSGRVYVRYEPRNGRKLLLKSPFPSIEFDRELLEAREGVAFSAKKPKQLIKTIPEKPPNTWQSLCELYFISTEFLQYSARDQRVRRGVLMRSFSAPINRNKPNAECFGATKLENFTTKAILVIRDRFACYEIVPDPMFPEDRRRDRRIPTKPQAGNSVVKYIRRVLYWAIQHHTALIGGINWANEVGYFLSGDGHKTWGPEECAAFERVHPQGTRMRLIYDLAKFSGQRLSDLVRLGPKMLSKDINKPEAIAFVQAKNRNRKPVKAFVPIFPELRHALNVAKSSGVLGLETFIEKTNGGSFKPESIGNLFRDGCEAAGLRGFSLHGLRKTAVVDFIKADLTNFQIMAITGHRSIKEIERYGREFMREATMKAALEKWLMRNAC